MNKVISFILPYMIVVIVASIHIFEIANSLIVASFVLGILSGFWYLTIYKVEGTKRMKYLTLFNIAVFIAMIILNFLTVQIKWMNQVFPTLIYLVIMECFGFYVLCQNKPRYTMTYKFSFKNKKRRYF